MVVTVSVPSEHSANIGRPAFCLVADRLSVHYSQDLRSSSRSGGSGINNSDVSYGGGGGSGSSDGDEGSKAAPRDLANGSTDWLSNVVSWTPVPTSSVVAAGSDSCISCSGNGSGNGGELIFEALLSDGCTHTVSFKPAL